MYIQKVHVITRRGKKRGNVEVSFYSIKYFWIDWVLVKKKKFKLSISTIIMSLVENRNKKYSPLLK